MWYSDGSNSASFKPKWHAEIAFDVSQLENDEEA
jgi:hypothetical protein